MSEKHCKECGYRKIGKHHNLGEHHIKRIEPTDPFAAAELRKQRAKMERTNEPTS